MNLREESCASFSFTLRECRFGALGEVMLQSNAQSALGEHLLNSTLCSRLCSWFTMGS